MNIYEWPALYEPALGENAKKYIFISYSHEDSDIVYQDLKVLSENGARIWYDKAMHVGQNWVERAKNRILDRNCAAVLFYVSTKSLKSDAFLQELEYALQREASDSSFSFMSINIGGQSAFETLKRVDIEEDAFLKILTAFNQRKLFIPRSENPLEQSHVIKLIDLFEEEEAIDLSKCQINTTQLFEYANYEQGIQVIKYLGADSIVTVPTLVNGRKVLAIGINAFRDNCRIKKINIPEGVKIIDDFAFSGCHLLETVSLPNSLTCLGYEAFRECYGLQEIVIPYNVTKIGDYCFYKCHNLSRINILSSVPLYIEFAAFSECHALENFVLPELTTFIGPYAFNNCINLGSIVIPKNVQEIGLSAFYSCASLSSVQMKSSKVLDNNKWFARCRNLSSIVIGAGSQSQYLFNSSWDECRKLLVFKLSTPINVVYDTGVLSWDSVEGADYYEILIEGKRYESKRPFFVIQEDNLNNNDSCYISAHSNNANILSSELSTEYKICSNSKVFVIETVEKDHILKSYNGNNSLVEIPSEVTVIGEKVFYNHEEIREVRLPNGIIRIEDKAFYHCLNLQKIEMPDSLMEIGEEAFWGAHIKELVLPMEMKKIGALCFACCNYLTYLRILSPKLVAGDKAFYRCINLKKVILPDGITEIFNGMFRGCTELDEIILPESVETIRAGSISYIMRLQRLIIPRSVVLIEEEAFSNSFALVDVFVDDQNSVFADKKGVLFRREGNAIMHYPADKKDREYHIDSSVTKVLNCAFMDAEHLEKVVIEANLSEIGRSAFERCPNLSEVIINGDVELIEKNVFKDCINLSSLALLGAVVPEIRDDIFANVSANFKILVPERYLKNYLRIIEWQKYKYLLKPLREA